ncbi:MAG: hypothetical protein GX759_00500 [Thermoanaerobacterales bacterium]|jgi:molybdopterin converting factor small subunit|nr:hypothetical protein [Thermoanaerobacterales bacterium]
MKNRYTVKYLGFVSTFTGVASETIEINSADHTVLNLISVLDARHNNKLIDHILDDEQKVLKVQVLVNGKAANISTVLKDKDEVVFYMPMFGG